MAQLYNTSVATSWDNFVIQNNLAYFISPYKTREVDKIVGLGSDLGFLGVVRLWNMFL